MTFSFSNKIASVYLAVERRLCTKFCVSHKSPSTISPSSKGVCTDFSLLLQKTVTSQQRATRTAYTVCGALHPYNKTPHVSETLFRQMEQRSANCTIHYGYHPLPDQEKIAIVEQCTFPSLRDFLYVELGHGIFTATRRGNAAFAGIGFFMYMVTKVCTVTALRRERRTGPAGRWAPELSLRIRSRTMMPGSSTSGPIRNTTPAS